MEVERYKIKLFLDVRPWTGSTSGFGIIQPNGKIGEGNPRDYFINVNLNRTYNVLEYINISKDPTKISIDRQLINPHFLEFAFFDTINKNKVNYGYDLTTGTTGMTEFIRKKRADISGFTDSQIAEWFDYQGYNELPWNEGTKLQVTIDDIDKYNLMWQDIISKANYFKIDINK